MKRERGRAERNRERRDVALLHLKSLNYHISKIIYSLRWWTLGEEGSHHLHLWPPLTKKLYFRYTIVGTFAMKLETFETGKSFTVGGCWWKVALVSACVHFWDLLETELDNKSIVQYLNFQSIFLWCCQDLYYFQKKIFNEQWCKIFIRVSDESELNLHV